MSSPIVQIQIVTFNDERTIVPCIQSLLSQESYALGKNLRIAVRDNASSDETIARIEDAFADKVSLHRNDKNRGFCEAHNEGLREAFESDADYVLIMNPDVALRDNVLSLLVRVLESDPQAGVATPKLLRAGGSLEAVEPPRFDSTGIIITPEIRHFDRGSNERDIGQYNKAEYVFGATGAAMLVRRAFVDDVSLDGEAKLFDEEFFAYREDADLAWRALWLGWKCRYVPEAVGTHERVVLPERRAALPAKVNELGVQNRFLLQGNNFSFLANAHCIGPTLWRNLLVLGSVLTVERSSMPALGRLPKLFPRALKRRKTLFARRRIPAWQMGRWFSRAGYSEPALASYPAREPIKRIVAVVVNYNGGSRAEKAIAALKDAREALAGGRSLEIVVLDNDSTDGSGEALEKLFSKDVELRIEMSAVNLGFSGGINAGVRGQDADAVLVLNPDVEVNATALNSLCARLDANRSLGMVVPVTTDHSGEPELSQLARSFRKISHSIAEIFFLHRLWPNNPFTAELYRRGDRLFEDYVREVAVDESAPYISRERPVVVEQPQAACALIRRSAYDDIGGFDEEFWPAWFEDVDFSVRLRGAGWLAAVDAVARVRHEGGYSKRELSSSDFARAWYPNMIRYHRKHASLLGFSVFRGALFVGLLMRSLITFLDGLLPGSRGAEYGLERRQLAKTLLKLGLNPSREFERFGSASSSVLPFSSAQVRESLGDLQAKFLRTADRVLHLNGHMDRFVATLPAQGTLGSSEHVVEEERDWRFYYASMLRGEGLEIGALHRPMVRHEKMHVKYVDRLTSAELREHYPELANEDLVEPDIIDDGETLQTIPAESFDFIIGAHLIEHMRNPLGSINQWRRVLKPGGYLYLVVPDKRNTFDKSRVRTTLEHMVLDYQRPSTERDKEHFLDYAIHVGGKSKDDALLEARSLIERDYSIHFHVFVPEDVRNLVRWFDENVAGFELVDGPSKTPGSDEFHLMLRRR